MTFRGCGRRDLSAALALRADVAGAPLRGGRRLITWIFPRRSILVAVDSAGRVVGMNLHYFRAQDATDVVHEGYIGVASSRQAEGIGSMLRRCAHRHFSATRVKGITSNIRADNAPSLHVARRLGFREIDAWLDADGGQTLLLYRDLRDLIG